MQTICLIGDTFTWFRPGKWGVDFQEMPKEVKILCQIFDVNPLTP